MSVDTAIAYIRAGQLDLAAVTLRRHLQQDPEDVPSNQLLGKLLFQGGQRAEGLSFLCRALGSAPADPELNFELGVMLLAQEAWTDAVRHFKVTLAQQPNHADCQFNLAWALRRQGKDEEAVDTLRRLLDQHPQFGQAWFNLGNILGETGNSTEAAVAYQNALAVMPGHPGVLTNLGALHQREGRLDQSVEACRAALAADPDMIAAGSTLGSALTAQGRLDEAIAVYAAMLIRHPNNPLLLHNQAVACKQMGRSAEAVALLDRALTLAPDMAEAWNILGAIRLDRDEVPQAEEALRRAIALRPDFVDAHNNLGKLLSQCGDNAGAMACFRHALAINPDNAAIHSNMLFEMLHIPEMSAKALFLEHRVFGLRQEAIAPREVLPAPQLTEDGRLRIGYVSPDFCEHAVMMFFEPVLQSHDRSRFEIFCYHTGTRVDAVTRRIMTLADHWRSLAGLPAAAASARIVADGIHILIDLAGHSAMNGLAIFARKPGHIQASWLGYPATTGLSRMDYRLTDPGCDAPRNDAFHTETLDFLPTAAAFRVQDLAPAIVSPPMLRRGHPRFGMFNRLAKTNRRTLDTWAKLLREEPTADLLMVIPGGDKTNLHARIHEQFSRRGIAADRILISGRVALEQFLELLTEVDVALDPFPYCGGTTSILTAWMGVPLICLAGVSAASSPSALLMESLGWESLVAHDSDGYIANARALVSDLPRQMEFRATIRERMQGLQLFTEAGITANLEAKYLEWWDGLLQDTARRAIRAALPLPQIGQYDDSDAGVVLSVRPDLADAASDRKGHVVKHHGLVDATNEQALFGAPVLEFAQGASLSIAMGEDADFGSEDFTIECWVRLTELPDQDHHILLIGRYINWNERANAWGIFIGRHGHCYGWVTGSGLAMPDHDWVLIDPEDSVIPVGHWTHVALVRAGDRLALFVNGKGFSQALPAGFSLFDSSLPITIGANADRDVHYFLHTTFVSGPRLTRGAARYGADFDPAIAARYTP